MKTTLRLLPLGLILLLISCGQNQTDYHSPEGQKKLDALSLQEPAFTSGYAEVNGIKIYYEIHGAGEPLVLLHGGGSTINSTYSRLIPFLAKTHKVIAIESQAHGRTSDRNAPVSFKQDADDVAGLLEQLKISSADILGFSNGGHTALEIGMRHPASVHKLIIASSFYKKTGVPAEFWPGFDNAKFSDMPGIYNAAFLKVNNDSAALINMFRKDSERMRTFKDWKKEELKLIKAPVLVVSGDHDLPFPEHTLEMAKLFSNGRLSILPGNHGSYLGEAMSQDTTSRMPELFAELVNEFLASPMPAEK